jgi:hypothetical protein
MSAKKTSILITSAVVIEGKIIPPKQGNKSVVTVDEAVAKNLMNRGKAELHTSDDDGDKPLSKHTVPELLDIAEDLEIDGAAKLKKPELIAAIEAAEAAEDN